MADMSAVDRGEYPEKSYWRSPTERVVFSGMVLYIIGCFFYIAAYYTWSGGQ